MRPLLYFGRLSAEKGVDDLLRSMQQVPHMRLIIAGDGPQRGELQELAASLGLSNVEFVGQVGRAERDALIARSRFTVLPSHAYETLGKTILESYARGARGGGVGFGVEAGADARTVRRDCCIALVT